MPKQTLTESVLQDWVHTLTFQQQALLLTAMRGPDENNKFNSAKAIVRYLRGVVIKPAGNWHGDNNNDFMWGRYAYFAGHAATFWLDHDEYPHHFIMHLVHCAEVAGYKHPDAVTRAHWNAFYKSACQAFHMCPETEAMMDARLNDFCCGIHNKK